MAVTSVLQTLLQVDVKPRLHEPQLCSLCWSLVPLCLPRQHPCPVTLVGPGPGGGKLADGPFPLLFSRVL